MLFYTRPTPDYFIFIFYLLYIYFDLILVQHLLIIYLLSLQYFLFDLILVQHLRCARQLAYTAHASSRTRARMSQQHHSTPQMHTPQRWQGQSLKRDLH